jgi:hypothetical protein
MKTKTKALVFILLSFVLGIILGWFMEERFFQRMAFDKRGGHGNFVKILNEHLHLNKEQEIKVDSILESNRKKMEVFKKKALDMRDSTRMQIRGVLNEDQQKLFDKFNQNRDREDLKRHEPN